MQTMPSGMKGQGKAENSAAGSAGLLSICALKLAHQSAGSITSSSPPGFYQKPLSWRFYFAGYIRKRVLPNLRLFTLTSTAYQPAFVSLRSACCLTKPCTQCSCRRPWINCKGSSYSDSEVRSVRHSFDRACARRWTSLICSCTYFDEVMLTRIPVDQVGDPTHPHLPFLRRSVDMGKPETNLINIPSVS